MINLNTRMYILGEQNQCYTEWLLVVTSYNVLPGAEQMASMPAREWLSPKPLPIAMSVSSINWQMPNIFSFPPLPHLQVRTSVSSLIDTHK